MEEDSVHVFVAMVVAVPVFVSVVVSVFEGHDSDDIHTKPGKTDDEQFANSVHLAP